MMMLRRFTLEERAASAAEFALVLPIFLLFLLGMIAAEHRNFGKAADVIDRAIAQLAADAQHLGAQDAVGDGPGNLR